MWRDGLPELIRPQPGATIAAEVVATVIKQQRLSRPEIHA